MTAHRIVVLAYWSDPCVRWTTAAARVRRWSNEWRRAGRDVTIVAADRREVCTCSGCRDSTGLPPGSVPVVVRPKTIRGEGRHGGDHGSGDTADHRWTGRALHGLKATREIGTTWVRPALRTLDEVLAGETRPTVLVTTSGPYSSLLVGRSVARRASVPWVADLRDPVSTPFDPDAAARAVRRAVRRSLRGSARAADVRIAAAPGGAAIDEAWIGAGVSTVLSGFDADEWSTVALPEPRPDDRETLRVGLMGTLYPGVVDPSEFLAAARHLRQDLARRVELHYWGRSGGVLRDLVSRFPSEVTVTDHGLVPPTAVRDEIVAMDATLHLPNSVPITITGRFYEQVAAGVPILSWGRLSAVEHDTIREQGGAVATTREELGDLLGSWVDDPPTPRPRPGPTHPVSSRTQAAEALRLIDEVARPSS